MRKQIFIFNKTKEHGFSFSYSRATEKFRPFLDIRIFKLWTTIYLSQGN